MTIMLMRLFYGVYFIGIAILVYHLFSLLVFQKEKAEPKTWLARILLIPIWPLALFSAAGRDVLKHVMRRI